MNKECIVKMCCKCNADLRYLDEIHRIDMKWYCDKCYKKYKKDGKRKQSILEELWDNPYDDLWNDV